MKRSTGRIFIAACAAIFLAYSAQLSWAGQPVVVGFETVEGFPAAGTDFTGLTNTNGGVVELWDSLNLNVAPDLGLHTDDGPGAPPGVFSDAPSPVGGAQIAGASGLSPLKAQVIMDLDNTQNLSLTSFHYANRGGYPPRLRVHYFGTSDEFLGTNSYTFGSDPTRKNSGGAHCYYSGAGGGCGVGLGIDSTGFLPVFQQITPTEPFKNVAVGKVVFESFADNFWNGDIPGANHGSFFLDDITLSPATTTFNADNNFRISFETNEGFADEDGASIQGTSIPGALTNITVVDQVASGVEELQVDHGPGFLGRTNFPGCCGSDFPETEPETIFGEQIAFMRPNGTGTGSFGIELDLLNSAELSPLSFWFAYRGNGSANTVTVEYFDLNEQTLGTETWFGSTDGGTQLGTDNLAYPEFDKLIVGSGSQTALPTVVGVPLSKMIITSDHNVGMTCGGGTSPCNAQFTMDDLLFTCTTGTCPGPPGGTSGDFNNDNVLDDLDIDILAAAVRNGTSDSDFNVDGLGGDVPDNADFDFYVTDSSFIGTLFGDHDLNKNVNFNDFVKLSNNFGNANTLWNQGNGNSDNFTNFNDFVRLSNNFGMMVASGSDVPEPAAVGLIAIGALVVGRIRRRKFTD